MADWKTRLDEAAKAASSGDEPDVDDGFTQVIDEVIEQLNRSATFARAERQSRQVGSLRKHTIVTYPRRLPVERSLMLSIAVAADYVSAPTPAGMGYLKDPSPEGLREYLVDFFTSDAFVLTLRHYRQRNEEPVTGWLKAVDYRTVDTRDHGITVQPDQQEKLARAFEDRNPGRLSLTVARAEPFGSFKPYSQEQRFEMLEAGGFVLTDVEHEPVEPQGTLKVSGVPKFDLDWMGFKT